MSNMHTLHAKRSGHSVPSAFDSKPKTAAKMKKNFKVNCQRFTVGLRLYSSIRGCIERPNVGSQKILT